MEVRYRTVYARVYMIYMWSTSSSRSPDETEQRDSVSTVVSCSDRDGAGMMLYKARCVSIWYIFMNMAQKDRRACPNARPHTPLAPSAAMTSGPCWLPAGCCRRPLRPEWADLALWATPVHASSMVESTADDHLTVDNDAIANVCRGAAADLEHAVVYPPERRRPSPHRIVDRRTQ